MAPPTAEGQGATGLAHGSVADSALDDVGFHGRESRGPASGGSVQYVTVGRLEVVRQLIVDVT